MSCYLVKLSELFISRRLVQLVCVDTMQCYFHGLAQIPRQNMVEDVAKEMHERKKRVHRNLAQVSYT